MVSSSIGLPERTEDRPEAIDASRALHACSQARYAWAQTLQCSCIPACCSHSSPQALQAAMQAGNCAGVMLAS